MLSRSVLKTIAGVVAVGLFIGGCSDDDNDDNFGNTDPGPAELTEVRIVHAVADAPLVNVFVDDELQLEEVDFRTGTAFLELASGSYDIRVEAIVPGGDIPVIDVEGIEFAAAERTTVLAVGDTSEGSISPLVVANPVDPIGAGNLRVQVTHASPDAPPVYVAVTAPLTDIEQAQYLGPFAFTETIGPVEIPAGDYRIRVAVGTPDPSFSDDDVVFDSGSLGLPAGADLQIAAVTSTVPSQAGDDGSPISLIVLDGDGSSDLFDVATGAGLRVVHNSTGAPAVNVVVDAIATPADENATIVENLSFSEFEDLNPPVAPLAYNVRVVLTESPSTEVLNFDADLMDGMSYTVIANDVVANITEWVLVDDNRRVATEAKVRVIHGSRAAGIVDVYVIPSASGLTPADVEPTLEDFEFGTETGYIGLAPDAYDIYVTGANSDIPAISALGIPVAGGGVYSAIARDPLEGESAPGLILFSTILRTEVFSKIRHAK